MESHEDLRNLDDLALDVRIASLDAGLRVLHAHGHTNESAEAQLFEAVDVRRERRRLGEAVDDATHPGVDLGVLPDDD